MTGFDGGLKGLSNVGRKTESRPRSQKRISTLQLVDGFPDIGQKDAASGNFRMIGKREYDVISNDVGFGTVWHQRFGSGKHDVVGLRQVECNVVVNGTVYNCYVPLVRCHFAILGVGGNGEEGDLGERERLGLRGKTKEKNLELVSELYIP